MVITSTPLRVSFFGGGTDYPVWYRTYGGSVLATTINKCCYITCRRLPPFFEYHSRISYSTVENVSRNDAHSTPILRVRVCNSSESRRELRFTTWRICLLVPA